MHRYPVPQSLNRSRRFTRGDISIEGSLSPFDFPHQVGVERFGDQVVVHFHYLMVSSESLEEKMSGAAIGKSSGRLMRLSWTTELDLDRICRWLEAKKEEVELLEGPLRQKAHYEVMLEDLLPYLQDQISHA